MKAHALIVLCLVLSSQAGCAQKRGAPDALNGAPARPAMHAMAPGAPGAPAKEAQQPAPGGAAKEDARKPAEVERKIKYTADLSVICDDFARAEKGLTAAIKEHKAVVAHSEVISSPGVPRGGLWRVRVPVAQFDGFRDAVKQLGEVAKDTADSEDVTEAYYDLENHIKNKLAEEESLRKLMEKLGSEKLENHLLLRDKLAAVRDYINREQGKLRVLANLTDLTTVTVNLHEKQKYVPEPRPEVAETPTFGMRVSRTFGASWDAFVGFLELIVLALIAVAPWAALLVVLLVPAALLARRWRRSAPVVRRVAQPSPPPPA